MIQLGLLDRCAVTGSARIWLCGLLTPEEPNLTPILHLIDGLSQLRNSRVVVLSVLREGCTSLNRLLLQLRKLSSHCTFMLPVDTLRRRLRTGCLVVGVLELALDLEHCIEE